MNNQVVSRETTKKAILYCRSVVGDRAELQSQSEALTAFAKANGLSAIRTILESGTMDALTYNNLRLQAKYREFNVLVVPELEVLGNYPIEITHEVNFLTENGVKIISLKDGELNVETLPMIFRKGFRLVKKSIVRAY